MQLIDDSGTRGMQCREMQLRSVKAMTGRLAAAIVKLLADHPDGMHASVIARRLDEHEQKIYYHTRRLLKAGILAVHHTDDSRGGTAKVLVLQSPAFAIRLGDYEPLARAAASSGDAGFLAPFIEHGKLNCRIV